MPVAVASALTRADLDAGRCENPGCKEDHPLAISPRCHPGYPVFAWYQKEEGCLMLVCAECGSLVAPVQVAWAT